MVLGTLGAIGDGMSINVMFVISSRIINRLGFGKSKLGHETFMGEVEKCTLQFVYLGLAVLVIAFLEGYCWSKTSERQVLKIRYKYLEAVLRQEVGFFDSQESTVSQVLDGISKDTSLIQEVLSDKVPTFFMHSSVFISGLYILLLPLMETLRGGSTTSLVTNDSRISLRKIPALSLSKIPQRVQQSKHHPGAGS
ncbi:hypothetical protein H6P81_009062 [Aristolochia fimbriata]|uniref:ABC transmembrane type-1 domain-containing protein n=1 Tax=Aristolochia fimbriata TaxID=158543 RepID=A0AAV7EN94_ARIFI|nr:hypothetical protein H6P81_009062 [Aristolochia fimbriata]